MASFDSTTIERSFTSLLQSNEYGYSGFPLNDILPDELQIEVLWAVPTVYAGNTKANGGTPITVANQSPSFQQAAQTLELNIHYTLDEDGKYISLIEAALPNSVFTVLGTTYYRDDSLTLPDGTSINGYIQIRRSTDINSALVTFAPGSRLTSDMLNASQTQLLNSVQELASFTTAGSSGSGSVDVDISGNSIFELSDVTNGGDGVLSLSGGTVTSGLAGSFVPAGGDAHEVLRKSTNADGALEWYNIDAEISSVNLVALTAQALAAQNQSTLNSDLGFIDQTTQDGYTVTRVQSPLYVAGTDGVSPGNITADKYVLDNGDATPPNLTFDNTTNGTYNTVYLQIPGTDTGGGSYLTRNQAGSVIRNTNASGYEWFYQAGNDYTDPSTWRQDGAILIDPRATHSSGENYSRVLNWNGTNSYQNHYIINGSINRSMWRDDDKTYTYVMSPGDIGGVVFQSTKVINGEETDIAKIDNDGNAYFRGNLTVDGTVIEGSDATIKTYVTDTTGSVVDKIQTLVTNGEAEALNPLSEIKFGTWVYNDTPTIKHYGPTTQGLAAAGLDIAKGVDNQLPAGPTEEATDETDASSGTAATTATQTIETLSMTGILTKAAAELKDLSDDSFTAIEAIDDYLINDLTPFLTNLNDRIAALENGTPGPTPGTMPDPPVLDLPGLGAG